MAKRDTRTRATGVLFAALAAIGVFAVTGCEVLVGETIPANVACTGDLPGTCEDGYFCGSAGTCTACPSGGCGSTLDAGHDAGMDAHVVVVIDSGHDAGHEAAPEDTGHDVSTSLGAIGESCTDNAQCVSGLTCVPASDLNGITLMVTSVCSKPCCTDADCGGTGFGCYPTTGGNLCVTSRALETCSNGACGTACCSDTDCASSGTSEFCSIGTTSAGPSPSCQAFGGDTQCDGFPDCSGVSGDPCASDSDCESGVCQSSGAGDDCSNNFDCVCVDPVTCCNNDECKSMGNGATCQWLETSDATDSTVVFRGCQAPMGNTRTTQACTSSTDCEGSVCEQFPGEPGKLCSAPCCQDSDCTGSAASAQWVCRPFVQSLGVGNLAILICQPPA